MELYGTTSQLGHRGLKLTQDKINIIFIYVQHSVFPPNISKSWFSIICRETSIYYRKSRLPILWEI